MHDRRKKDVETLSNIVAFVSDRPGMAPSTDPALCDAGHHADDQRGHPAAEAWMQPGQEES